MPKLLPTGAALVPALFVLISMCGSPVPDPGGTINGVAYYDANRNAIHDSCDANLSQATVAVTGRNGATIQTTTAGDGSFRIEHAPAGDDIVSLAAAPGFTWPVTTTSGNGTPGVVVHVEELKETSGWEIGSASRSAFDTSRVAITGILFNDTNGNGTVDKNECGINPASAIQDIHYDSGRTSTLRSDGTYELRDVSAVHDVAFTLAPTNGLPSYVGSPEGWTPTTAAVSSDLCSFSAIPLPRYGTTIYEANVGLTHDVATGSTGSITGVVFIDGNDNGVRDGGEAPVANTSITLLPTDSSCAVYYSPLMSYTDNAGQFSRYSVPAGTYTLSLEGPSPSSDNDTLLAPSTKPETVTIAGNMTLNIPLHSVPGADVFFHAFDDADGDGRLSDGESVVPGLQICLGITAAQIYGTSSGPAIKSGPGNIACGSTGSGQAARVGPLFAGTYPFSLDSFLGPVTSLVPAGETISVTEGQQLDYYLPVKVLSAAEQVIPAGTSSSSVDQMHVCHAEPDWIQPPFDENNVADIGSHIGSGPSTPPAETHEEMYSHGIYNEQDGLPFIVWKSAAGLDWKSSLAGCNNARDPIFDFVNYEPLSSVTGKNVTQVVLRRHDSGLWGASVPFPISNVNRTERVGWYLFVDENYEPLARCSSYNGFCEWYK